MDWILSIDGTKRHGRSNRPTNERGTGGDPCSDRYELPIRCFSRARLVQQRPVHLDPIQQQWWCPQVMLGPRTHNNGQTMPCPRTPAMAIVPPQHLRLEVSSEEEHLLLILLFRWLFCLARNIRTRSESMMFGKPSSRSDETGPRSFVPDCFVGFAWSSLLVIRRRKATQLIHLLSMLTCLRLRWQCWDWFLLSVSLSVFLSLFLSPTIRISTIYWPAFVDLSLWSSYVIVSLFISLVSFFGKCLCITCFHL